MSFTLNNLTETQFEEFCFDLLQSLDFINLNWRKGTGLTSSPADQGRDIQGQLVKKDIDGSQHIENWFIECKHYIKGVPPDKIQGAISWANAKRPDVLLIIASNFLSNPTKNYLEEYQSENRPPYRIKVWELKDIENITAGKNNIRRKYNLATTLSFLPILSNYHIAYTMKPQINTIEYLIELMDSLDSVQRDIVFEMTYFDIVRPRFRTPITGNEKVKDLMLDSPDYLTFRARCLEKGFSSSPNFVHNLITSTLAWIFNFADKTSLIEMQNVQTELIEQIEQEITNETNERRIDQLKHMIELPKKTLRELPERVEKSYDAYIYICEELVRKLLTEKPRIYS